MLQEITLTIQEADHIINILAERLPCTYMPVLTAVREVFAAKFQVAPPLPPGTSPVIIPEHEEAAALNGAQKHGRRPR